MRGGGLEGRRIEVEYRAREGMGDHTTVWCRVAWWGGVTLLTVKCCAVLHCEASSSIIVQNGTELTELDFNTMD